MSNIEIVIGSARADKIQAKLQDHPKLPTLKIDRLSLEAEELLLNTPLIVFIDKGKLGKSREVTEENLLTLIDNARYFQNKHIPAYLSNIPPRTLSDTQLTVVFLKYQNNIQLSDHLSNILFLSDKILKGSTAGKIDYAFLEKDFLASLPKDKLLSMYIPSARKHSYKKMLSINTRTTKASRGNNHERD
jgi:hypothetical protein